MNSISPTYYAAGTSKRRFELEGENFDLIPDDAVGYGAVNNNWPTQFDGSDDTHYRYGIIEKENNRIVLELTGELMFSIPGYLGCISKDGIVYWQNETAPLP